MYVRWGEQREQGCPQLVVSTTFISDAGRFDLCRQCRGPSNGKIALAISVSARGRSDLRELACNTTRVGLSNPLHEEHPIIAFGRCVLGSIRRGRKCFGVYDRRRFLKRQTPPWCTRSTRMAWWRFIRCELAARDCVGRLSIWCQAKASADGIKAAISVRWEPHYT